MLTSVIIYTTALLIVLYRDSIVTVTSAAGLALSNALQLLVFLQWSVRMLGDVQAQMGSVGQVTYYGSDAVAQEAPAEIPTNKPDAAWPAEGTIEFKNVVLRYQEDGVDVLKKVSFKVNPREKVGLVGRTGSGKSTLLVALLRIVELAEGEILIDGINIKTLGLNDLRTAVAVSMICITYQNFLTDQIRSSLKSLFSSSARFVPTWIHSIALQMKLSGVRLIKCILEISYENFLRNWKQP